jgi:NAD(P)-dependent dehydrogenase (short-subunit alcohol dehydrogenase family)
MTDENETVPESPKSHFPSHAEPRTWLISSGDTPIGLALARNILSHGDRVVAGLVQANLLRDENRRHLFQAFMAEVENSDGGAWKPRFRAVMLDIRYFGQPTLGAQSIILTPYFLTMANIAFFQ